jgi:hypothetical protein
LIFSADEVELAWIEHKTGELILFHVGPSEQFKLEGLTFYGNTIKIPGR